MIIDDNIYGEVHVTCDISKKLVNDTLICPTAYEVLNHNVILCTKAENIFSLTCDVGSENENDPQMDNQDEEVEGKLNFNAQKANRENHELTDFGEKVHAEIKNNASDRRIRESFSETIKNIRIPEKYLGNGQE